jgi:hypothetical protein
MDEPTVRVRLMGACFHLLVANKPKKGILLLHYCNQWESPIVLYTQLNNIIIIIKAKQKKVNYIKAQCEKREMEILTLYVWCH